jgi:hypothetical protein
MKVSGIFTKTSWLRLKAKLTGIQTLRFRSMQTLTKLIRDARLANRLLTDQQLKRLVDGSDQRRYNLVNRAMNEGELVRLRRGLYVMANSFRSAPCHPFAMAQMFEPGSYVSLESALSYHEWIPEAVYTTTSILPGRKRKEYQHEKFGMFTFHPLAIQPGFFLESVQRVEADKQSFLLASPLRAFMDLVCFRKIEWRGMDWIESGLRIDREVWSHVTDAQLRSLKSVYKHQRAQRFLHKLEVELGLEFTSAEGPDHE